ncbi:MAG: hypothetical protein KKF62_04060 [Bacteroidetes bacterium]|nr:hypothetical protein [Bacteroidota bacterium]MBU1117217.1 hypothetical protein [Bacteroidota bacterium]MBU1800139.1 hypothetical protein [Bacteroidota bacterium]
MNEKLVQISTDRLSKISIVKILTTIGSIISIGFGIWHFFIPGIWDWYSHFDKAATELVIAVRAINIFFSLLLVLLGIANILIVFKIPLERFSAIVILSISTVLWTTRLVLQIIYPQGSQNPVIQYSMLSVFILVFICFSISLLLIFTSHNHKLDPKELNYY